MPSPTTRPSFALTRRTALVAAGQTAVRLGQLAIIFVLVRLLSPTAFSNLNLLLTVYIAGIGIGSLNIQQSVYFFYARLPSGERRAFTLQTLTLLAGAGALCAAVVFGVAPLLGGTRFAVATPLRWLALALLLEVPTLAAPELLVATERLRASVVFSVVFAAAQIGAIVVPAVLGCNAEVVAKTLVGYAAARALGFALFVWPRIPRGALTWSRARIVEQFVFMAPLGLAMATSAISKQLDKWLVAWLLPDQFGTYVVAGQEVPLIPVVPYAIGAVVATRLVHAFAAGDHGRVRDYWLAITSRTSLLVVPLTIFLIAAAPEIIPWYATGSYAAATLPFCIYNVILLHRVAEYGVMLRAAGRTRDLWAASVCLLLASVLFGPPLILLLGTPGAALGTLLANVAAWLFALRCIARAMRVPFRQAFPWRHYGVTVGVAVLAGAGCYWGTELLLRAAGLRLGAGWVVVIKAAAFAGLYLGATRLAGLTRRLPDVPADSAEFVEQVREPSG
jgi:O-antigen/teichoic acid export membrane protein